MPNTETGDLTSYHRGTHGILPSALAVSARPELKRESPNEGMVGDRRDPELADVVPIDVAKTIDDRLRGAELMNGDDESV